MNNTSFPRHRAVSVQLHRNQAVHIPKDHREPLVSPAKVAVINQINDMVSLTRAISSDAMALDNLYGVDLDPRKGAVILKDQELGGKQTSLTIDHRDSDNKRGFGTFLDDGKSIDFRYTDVDKYDGNHLDDFRIGWRDGDDIQMLSTHYDSAKAKSFPATRQYQNLWTRVGVQSTLNDV